MVIHLDDHGCLGAVVLQLGVVLAIGSAWCSP